MSLVKSAESQGQNCGEDGLKTWAPNIHVRPPDEAPNFSLAQPWLSWTSGGVNQRMENLSLSLCNSNKSIIESQTSLVNPYKYKFDKYYYRNLF